MTETPKPPLAPVEWKIPPFFGTIAVNFASFSAIALVISALCSTAFIYGYLAMFDWQLIWLIEYTDILKIGLVMFAIMSGLLVFVGTYVQNIVSSALALYEPSKSSKLWDRIWPPLSLVLIVATAGAGVFQAFSYSVENQVALIIFIGAIGVWIVTLTIWIASPIKQRRQVLVKDLVGIGVLVTLGMLLCGAALGGYVLGSKDARYDVFLKDREMPAVRLIMITPHHTVIYVGDITMVMQTADVIRIIRRP